MRIELDNREKQLIHEYWYAASKDMQAQLLNMRRKTIDIAYEELQDLVGYLGAIFKSGVQRFKRRPVFDPQFV